MSASFGIPKFVILGFKTSVATIAASDDGFLFNQVRSLKLSIGAEQYPQETMKSSVDLTLGRSRCSQAYDAYANFCWKMGNEPTMSINHFRMYDAIFCFDCTAHHEMIGSITANITLDMEFVAAPVGVTAYAILFSDARFIINTDSGKMTQISFA